MQPADHACTRTARHESEGSVCRETLGICRKPNDPLKSYINKRRNGLLALSLHPDVVEGSVPALCQCASRKPYWFYVSKDGWHISPTRTAAPMMWPCNRSIQSSPGGSRRRQRKLRRRKLQSACTFQTRSRSPEMEIWPRRHLR